MRICCNGADREVAEDATVADLVADVTGDQVAGTAVALDGEVVPRRRWSAVLLHPDARVEVLRAVQGG